MIKLFVKAATVVVLALGPFMAAADRTSGVSFGMAALVCWGLPLVVICAAVAWRRAVWRTRGRWMAQGARGAKPSS